MQKNINFRSGFVAIVGRPNVGKSTLLNRVLGQKIAIMSDKAQTTRHKIQGVYTDQTAQIIFMDTPGIHKPKHALGEFMLEAAYSALKEVEVILFLVNAGEPIGRGDRFIIERLKQQKTPVFLIINKIDLVHPDDVLTIIETYQREMDFTQIIPISALQGNNVDHLLDVIKAQLPEGPQYYPADQVTDHPEYFVVAEFIREKVLQLTKEEVPHSVAVVVDQMQKNAQGKVHVYATIIVERSSQKGIVIGKGGKLLKEIGTRARRDIESLLGEKIFLELWVKVQKDWRDKQSMLDDYGYKKKDYK